MARRSRAEGSVVVVVVLGVQAVQDGSPEREDGGAPGQTVTPVELVVYSQADGLDELDGEQDQATGLQDNCGGTKTQMDKISVSIYKDAAR